MNQRKIEDEAEFYSTHLDFLDDKNLNEKGRGKIKEWTKQDFIAGANWMMKQLRLEEGDVFQKLSNYIENKEYNYLNGELITFANDIQKLIKSKINNI